MMVIDKKTHKTLDIFIESQNREQGHHHRIDRLECIDWFSEIRLHDPADCEAQALIFYYDLMCSLAGEGGRPIAGQLLNRITTRLIYSLGMKSSLPFLDDKTASQNDSVTLLLPLPSHPTTILTRTADSLDRLMRG